ncbi:unnamed protein product [Owenia fusiformis]|uniref:Uncharacterized protein n=1 Tax=Owenia fusiformis TaxID=6347 RepID=A0A8J1UW25_OWEFU|nr:unnamed protein product [Owenia fusiformis]
MAATLTLLLWSCLIAPVFYILWTVVKFWQDVKKRGKAVMQFPGEPPHWLWGHLHLYPGPNERGLAFQRAQLRITPVTRFGWIGAFHPVLALVHPSSIKTILRTSEPKPLTFGGYVTALPWLGDGLLISKGKKWLRNRKLLTPAFHFDILKPYMKVNNEAADILLNKLDGYSKKSETFEVFNAISSITLDIILRCAFSFESNCQLQKSHPYVTAVKQLGDGMVYRLLRPWLWNDFIYFNLTSSGRQFRRNCDFVHKVSEDLIAKRKKTLEEQGVSAAKGRYLDFLDVLLTARDEDGQGLTDREIRDEADTFLFEGHDTTASGISWTLYSLAEHPEHQQKCREEVQEILAGRDSDHITWEDLPKMKYLTLCIKEALRLHTPVPFIERRTTKDMEIEGKFLPAGSVINMMLYNIHHNPTVWENSMEYRPSRFLPENMKCMDSYAFIPFSAGPRNCIGQNFAMHEMKVTIGRILNRFRLELDPNHKTEHVISVVMKTKDGMMMNVTPVDKKPSENDVHVNGCVTQNEA